MKKTLAIALVLGVLSLGAVASAHMWGGGPGGWGGGPGWGAGPGACGGPAWGGGQGRGFGPGACGGPAWGAQSEESKKFFEATAKLRRELHGKMFEYREAYRTGDDRKVEELGKEIDELRTKVAAKAKEAGLTGGWGPRRGFGPRGGGFGPGSCGGPGSGVGPYGGW